LENVEEAFTDLSSAEHCDEVRSESEHNYIGIGLTRKGLLATVYTIEPIEDKEVCRIIIV